MTGANEEYRVHLDAFEGPLDLLLYLIRRAEVDITDIPIAAITGQYMDYLRGIEGGGSRGATAGKGRIDIELAGEFLVMAATLMEIKSRMLMPVEPQAGADAGGGEGGEGTRPTKAPADPRADLVRQLLAYKQYRDASAALEGRLERWQSRYPSARAPAQDPRMIEALRHADELDLEELDLVDLIEAFGKVMESVNFDRLGDHVVTYDDTPIELHAQDLLDRLTRDVARGEELPLIHLFAGRTRGEMLGLFLATLELVRQRAVAVRQDRQNGAILIMLRDQKDEETGTALVQPDGAPPAP